MPLEYDTVKEMYNSGLSMAKIAKGLGVTDQSVFRFMKANNIVSRKLSEASSVKIITSKEQISQIWKLYELGNNRQDIASTLDITEWAVRKIIQGNCREKGESLKLYHMNNTVPISYEQEQLILGSLLGDASLVFDIKDDSYEFQVGHCLEQKEFLAYKAGVLNTNVRSFFKDKASYSSGKEFFITSYSNKYELQRIYSLCFRNRIKSITKEWAFLLDAPAIAIWYMDDGSSSFSHNAILARFSTLSFDRKELEILQRRLEDFSIYTTLQKHTDGKGLIIAIRQESINKFMDLIDPYIVDCMKYKIKRRINEPNYRFRAKNIKS